MLLYYIPILCPKYFMLSKKVILDLNQINVLWKLSSPKIFYNENNLNQALEISQYYLALLSVLLLLLMLQVFVFESVFLTRLEKSDWSTDPISFISASSMSLRNLLWSEVVNYFHSISDILAS